MLALSTSLLGAQEVTGRIEGRVLGPNDAGLEEVQVTASGASLLGTRVALTDRTGRFLLHALPVGTYRVTVKRIGYRAVAVEGVSVRLGETANLPRISLLEAPVELEEITVSAEAVGLDPASTASSTRLDAHQLDALPIRDYRDIALLATGAIPSYLGGAGGIPDGINIGGATGIENTYYLDGINVTNVLKGGPGIDIPYNFIKQLEIRTGGSTGEDAQALGGVINVVTPGGGERLRGGGFAFYSADGLRAEPKSLDGTGETGFHAYDVGARVEGPALRQRLWFFGAYNLTSHREEQAPPFEQFDNTGRKHLFAGKLTWLAGPRTSAALSIIGGPERSEYMSTPLFSSGVRTNPDGAARKGEIDQATFSLRGSHLLRTNLTIDGSLAQTGYSLSDEPAAAAGRAPVVIDALSGTISGGGGGTSSSEARRRSAGLAASWHLRSHVLRVGALHEWLYVNGGFDDSRMDGGTITRADTNLWYWHTNRSENASAENRTPSIFVQDAWQVSSRLLLSAGLRWSRQTVGNPVSGAVNFQVADGLQPRVGVVFQLGRIGTQRVYASYGRVANQVTLRGVDELNGFGAETLFVFPQDPRVDTSGGSIDFARPNGVGFSGDGTLRGETADEWALGYDRKLAGSLSLSLRAVLRAHGDAVQIGFDTLGVLVMGNPGRGALAHFPFPDRTYHALELTLERAMGARSPWVRASYVLSRTHGNYPGLYGSDWSLDFGHVGPLYFTPEQHLNGTGFLPNHRRHVLKLFGAQPIGSRIVVGTSFLLASGTPLSEYGAIPAFGPPFRGLVSQRGTVGRTPTIWDLSFRAAYDLPSPWGPAIRTRLLFDLEHVGNPRTAVDYDQIHYTCLDDKGNQACPNAGYGRVIQYQPPMSARLGAEMGF